MVRMVRIHTRYRTKFWPSHRHPQRSTVRRVPIFSHSRYGYLFKIVQQANKKINETICNFGSVTDVYLLFSTAVLVDLPAGHVSSIY
jgi:hypothetical protein